jgi:hypothetical protein
VIEAFRRELARLDAGGEPPRAQPADAAHGALPGRPVTLTPVA